MWCRFSREHRVQPPVLDLSKLSPPPAHIKPPPTSKIIVYIVVFRKPLHPQRSICMRSGFTKELYAVLTFRAAACSHATANEHQSDQNPSSYHSSGCYQRSRGGRPQQCKTHHAQLLTE
jgi:hypothetical protein